MPKRLSPKSTLDTLRKEAKRTLKAMRAADPTASLRSAQHAVARDYGFENWIALTAALADLALGRLSPEQRAEAFLRHCDWGGDMAAAHRILSRHPEIAGHDLLTALVCGDVDAVERRLAKDPEAARRKAGPLDREPLLYLAYGRFDGANAVALAARLLDLGADPNAWFDDGWGNPFTAICGAIGLGEGVRPPHPQAEALTDLLLARGAEPFDSQALYNTSIVADGVHWIGKLWAAAEARGETRRWTEAGGGALGRAKGMSTLDYLLGNAVGQNHLTRADWLLSRGADAKGLHSYSGRPLHALAQLSGFVEMADLLERHGAEAVQLTGIEALQAASLRLDEPKVRALIAADPALLNDPAPLLAAAELGRDRSVRLLLQAGFPAGGADGDGISPLHRAVQAGSLEAVDLLIAAGAEVDLRERRWNGTPLSWCAVLGRPRLAARLAPISRDPRALASLGLADRLAEVLQADPGLANHRLASDEAPTPLFCLPDDEEDAAAVARVLCAHGADPTVRNTAGLTPVAAARRRGLEDAAEVIEGA